LAGLLGAGLTLAAARAQHAGHAASPAGTPAPAARDPLAGRFGGPFALVAHDGRRVTERDFLGRHMLVYFGFTRCTETCPIDLPMIAAALDRLGRRAEAVTPVFISVDPEDDPARLAPYVAAFHPRLVGLGGSEAEIAAVARAYRVHRRKLATSRPTHGSHAGHDSHAGHNSHAGHGGYTIDHGSLLYLMGPDGRFLSLLPHASGSERIAEMLARHLPP
jgi:protein SCO1/2